MNNRVAIPLLIVAMAAGGVMGVEGSRRYSLPEQRKVTQLLDENKQKEETKVQARLKAREVATQEKMQQRMNQLRGHLSRTHGKEKALARGAFFT